MKLISTILSCLLFLSCTAAELNGIVTKVSDGDTVTVAGERIRLYAIDAPEMSQPGGNESRNYLARIINRKMVRIEYKDRDKYGRILGTIWLGNTNVNLKMLTDGYAWHYSYFDKTPAYAKAEHDARAAKRGIWVRDDNINPYQWRKSHPRRR